MTKSEKREANHSLALFAAGLCDAGYAARSISALIRSALGKNTRNELIKLASSFPAVVQHHNFIVA